MAAHGHATTDSGPAAREIPAAPQMPAARLLTAEEVASRLGVHPSWVKKAARAGRIPHIRVGRYRRFRWPEIEEWLQSQRA